MPGIIVVSKSSSGTILDQYTAELVNNGVMTTWSEILTFFGRHSNLQSLPHFSGWS